MIYKDVVVSREHRYSIGIKTDDDRRYVSIPVSNGMVDYEEYYEIDRATYDRFCADGAAALAFAEECRQRKQDARLIQKPGKNRGTAL